MDSSTQVAASDCLGDMGLVVASLGHIHAVGVEDRGHLEDQGDHDQEGIDPCLLGRVGRNSDQEEGVSGHLEGQQAPEAILISFAPGPFEVVATQEIEVGCRRCLGPLVLHGSDSH